MLLHWFKSLFIDELWVFIHPQRIVLLRLTRPFKNGFKQQVVHKQVSDLPHHLMIKSNDTNDWKILNQYLKQVFKNLKWQGAMSTVIVSNHFARYAIIPWNNELATEAERQAYMQHCFNLAYGELAKAWGLRMSESGFGQPAIASAINRGLLQVLHDVFAEADMKLVAVHPQLVLAINQTVSQVKQQYLSRGKNQKLTFWLVAIQSGRVCLTLLENGGWRVVKNVAIEADVSEQVTALMQREIVNCNVNADVPVLLYWSESHRNKPLKLTNHKAVKVLPHQFDIQNGQLLNSLPDWVLA